MTILLSAQAQLEKEAQETEHLAQIEEQERRDHELALRLASETNSGVDDMTPSLKRYSTCFAKDENRIPWVFQIFVYVLYLRVDWFD